MSRPVSVWREEHLRFARLLDLLEGQLDRFHYGERPDYPLMLEAMRYMTRYVDARHHPREDLAFARLAERRAQSRRIVKKLLDEHQVIVRDGERLVMLLEEVLDDAFIAREDVERPGRAYIQGLRAHMRCEERLFPWVASTLDARDWAEIDKAVPVLPDPLLSPAGQEAFESLRRLLARPPADLPGLPPGRKRPGRKATA